MDNVVILIKNDHATFRWFCDKLEDDDARPDEITDLLTRMNYLLVPHSEAEESAVYPAISAVVPKEDDEVKDGTAEHHHIEELVDRLLAQPADAPGADGMLAAMIAELRHHLEEEEEDILPTFAAAADPELLETVGVAFREAKEAIRTAKGFPPPESPELIDLTKDDLYVRAQLADVDGRAEMTKDQLIAALQSI